MTTKVSSRAWRRLVFHFITFCSTLHTLVTLHFLAEYILLQKSFLSKGLSNTSSSRVQCHPHLLRYFKIKFKLYCVCAKYEFVASQKTLLLTILRACLKKSCQMGDGDKVGEFAYLYNWIHWSFNQDWRIVFETSHSFRNSPLKHFSLLRKLTLKDIEWQH